MLRCASSFPADAEKVMEICMKSGIVTPDMVIDQV